MMDVINVQAVGLMQDKVVVMLPKNTMTRAEALTHAAWLVSIASVITPKEDEKSFEEILEAVQCT